MLRRGLGLVVLLGSALAQDPSCNNGIQRGSTCCAKECGVCGGSGCGGHPGGAANCCGGKITRSCAAYDPPCNIVPEVKCTNQAGWEYTGNTVQTIAGASLESCCAACTAATVACHFYTWNSKTLGCDLKSENAPDHVVRNAAATSGIIGTSPPAPIPPALVEVTIDTSSTLWSTLGNYVCFNLDASRNRQFFDRDLSVAHPLGAQMALQAAALGAAQAAGFSLIRFGGSGNDYLTYAFNGTECPVPASAYQECMNQTWWTNVLQVTECLVCLVTTHTSPLPNLCSSQTHPRPSSSSGSR
jgi:hypothetical protein